MVGSIPVLTAPLRKYLLTAMASNWRNQSPTKEGQRLSGERTWERVDCSL